MRYILELNLLVYEIIEIESFAFDSNIRINNFEKMGEIGKTGRFRGIPINYSAMNISPVGEKDIYEGIQILANYKASLEERSLTKGEIDFRLNLSVYSNKGYSFDFDHESIQNIFNIGVGLALSIYSD